jgi:acetate kinase
LERIGIENSLFVIKYDDNKKEIESFFNTHKDAIDFLLEYLTKEGFIKDIKDITKVGHRVVQGGEIFKDSCVVDQDKLEQIYELSKLAPLHNGPNADGIKVFMQLMPHATNVAVFDTEFHQTMPQESFLYPVPYSWYKDHHVRRYGMHGTSHKYVSNQLANMCKKDLKDMNVIVCHLGNGASISAIKNGKVLTTSMGLTPLAGIMMGTRSGDIDPSIIEYMVNQTGKSVSQITNSLNKESGLLGISGISSDCRDVGAAMDSGDERAKLAFEIYNVRLIETVGAYAARLGSLDAIAFTGGIGENVDHIRKNLLDGLSILGIKIDNELNENRSLGDRLITAKDSKVSAYIVTTDEEYQIAFEAERF